MKFSQLVRIAEINLGESLEVQEAVSFSHAENIAMFAKLVAETFKRGGKVLVCGNGGSACDAMHFASELTGKFQHVRKALPAISLTDMAHLTCVANDFGYAEVFSRGVEALANKGDLVVCISTSGKSENVVRAASTASAKGGKVVALVGGGSNLMEDIAHLSIFVPSTTTARIQEIHTQILHIVVECVEHILFPELYEEV